MTNEEMRKALDAKKIPHSRYLLPGEKHPMPECFHALEKTDMGYRWYFQERNDILEEHEFDNEKEAWDSFYRDVTRC